MSSSVEQIKGRLSITDVVGSYIRLEKAGVNLKARCPFHNEKTPSFFVSPVRNNFHCFGCGKGGDIFTFVQDIEGVDFEVALTQLAERAGVELRNFERKEKGQKERVRSILEKAVLFYEKELANYPAAGEYLGKRGLKDETIKSFRIGFAPREWGSLLAFLKKDRIPEADLVASGMFIEGDRGLYDRFRSRIMFPVFDYMGNIIGFSARLYTREGEKSNEREAKYINTPDTILYHKSKTMYGLDKAKQSIRESGQSLLVEGQMDVVMSHQAGVTRAVAASGTAVTIEHLTLLERIADSIIVVLDADMAGFVASSRTVKLALGTGLDVAVVSLPKGKDPADFALENPDGWKDKVSSGKQFVDYALEFITAEAPERKEEEKLIREHLYPFLGSMSDALRKDESLMKLANHMKLSPDALREDFSNWQSKQSKINDPRDKKSPEIKAVSRKDRARNQLIGIALWQRGTPDGHEHSDKIEKHLKELLGDSAEELSLLLEEGTEEQKKRKESLVFEAESYYNDRQSLISEIDTLLRALEKEILASRLGDTLLKIREAEGKGDTAQVNRLLHICQKLSYSINSLNIR